MGSYIYDNRRSLEERHYVRKAGTEHYWFDFSSNKVEYYRKRFGDAFCLVLFGSETQDDTYVMPFGAVAGLFDRAQTDHRGRWIGTVTSVHPETQKPASEKEKTAHPSVLDLARKE